MFFIFFLIFSNSKKITFRNFFDASISGLLFHGLYLGGVFYALSKGISASVIALIVSLTPILTSVLAKIYLNEIFSKMQWIGTLLGFTGAVIIIFSDLKEGLSLIAVFAGLIGLISSSIGMIWQKRISSNLSLSGNNFIQALSASVFHLILALLFENYFMNFTNDFIFAMSWQIIAISLGAFLILMWLLKNKQANQTSSLYFLIPPVSAIMAYFVLNDQMSYLDIMGLLISSVGVFFVIKFKHKTL